MKQETPALLRQFADLGVTLEHHFGGGVYVKRTNIPAGMLLTQHAHDHDHLSWLSSGSVVLTVDGEPTRLDGPCMVTVAAGKQHEVEALTDAVWLCIWSQDYDTVH